MFFTMSFEWSQRLPNRADGVVATVARQPDAVEAIPGLPNYLVVTHINRSEYSDDPADLARLPAVSRAMRDTMVGTGLRFEELKERATI